MENNQSRSFDRKAAESAFQLSRGRAGKIMNDPDQIEMLLKRLEKKLTGLPVVGDALTYIPAMGLMVNSYIKKEYQNIPIGTITAVIGAIIYFVSPIDLIPDFIPAVGAVDDAAVVGIALAIAKTDIDEYLAWRKVKGLDNKFSL